MTNRGQRIRNKITIGRIRLYQQRSATCNGQLPMQIYRGYPAFYPVVYAQAMRRGDEKLGRDFHRGRHGARFADRRRSTVLDASFH